MVRKTNQDDVNFKLLSDCMAWSVVCDGMGGANGGDIASKEAVNFITDYLSNNLSENISHQDIEQVFVSAVKKANDVIYSMSQEDKQLSGMGTTVVLAMVYDHILHVVHVGDSRAYVVNDTQISQVTLDHSIVQELINNGEITLEQAETHPRKNIITRALGISSEVSVDYRSVEIKDGDIVLLCTDGLTNDVSIDDIHSTIKGNNLVCVPDVLIDMANKNGGNDNITVSLIVQ